jgi:dephospho-CoA kinase
MPTLQRSPSRQRVLCICGPPAAGKSTAATIIARRADVVVLESGQVVAELLGRGNVHQLSRQEQDRFRRDALSLVTGPGTTPLVRALRRRIRSVEGALVLVGVRNASTIEGLLRSRRLELRVLFLDAPFRLRVRRYRAREGTHAVAYATLVRARTEAEHAALRARADETVDNGSDLRALAGALSSSRRWLTGR